MDRKLVCLHDVELRKVVTIYLVSIAVVFTNSASVITVFVLACCVNEVEGCYASAVSQAQIHVELN